MVLGYGPAGLTMHPTLKSDTGGFLFSVLVSNVLKNALILYFSGFMRAAQFALLRSFEAIVCFDY